MSKIAVVKSVLKWYWGAKTQFDVHAPFLFNFIENTIEDKRQYYAFEEIEALKERLFINNKFINVTDFGAGSRNTKSNRRRIKDIAKTAVSTQIQCELLFRIVQHLQPNTILEIGTSLGIASMYLQSAKPDAKMITMEGCPQIASVARGLFQTQNLNQIKLVEGEFGKNLVQVFKELGRIDFAYIDGNHREDATVDYFKQILPFSSPKTVLIFDDIHWSAGMERAWNQIRSHKKSIVSIDLFDMGIVFLDPNLTPNHFSIVASKYKPLRLGLF